MPDYTAAAKEIKEKANIIDVVGGIIQLKKGGTSYMACCPFHNEKTPSFSVSDKYQSYKCFGCGASGDVISFVEEYYHISFTEAVERLAAQYGVTIERTETAETRKRAAFLEINKKAAMFYLRNLIQNTNNEGYKYIEKRKLSLETVKKFGLGYTGKDYDGLTKFLLSQNIPIEMLLELGLSSRNERGNVYDKYRDRLIIPIIDTRKNVIGFGGRILNDGEPKYLNSSESDVFKKKNNLFGLNLAKEFIRESEEAILVEGYMDMISLFQNGVKNVVASLGTSLTDEQAKLLRRYCNKVILCYDSDNAGKKAALRGIDILRKAEMEVKVLNVVDAKDPDEYVKKYGRDAFLKLKDEVSLDHVYYKIKLLNEKYPDRENSTSSQVNFLKEVADIIRGLTPIEQEVYIPDVAKKLGVHESSIKGSLHSEVPVNANTKVSSREENETVVTSISKADLNLEKIILILSYRDSNYFSEFLKYDSYAFVSILGKKIKNLLIENYSEDCQYSFDQLVPELDDDDEYIFLKDIANNNFYGNEEDAFTDCIRKLKEKKYTEEINNINIDLIGLQDLISSYPDNKELETKMNELLLRKNDLLRMTRR